MFEGIYFANPNYLWLLLVLPAVIIWHSFTWRKAHPELKMSSLSSFSKQKSFLSLIYPILFVFRIFAMTLIILAIARPQTVDISTRTKTNNGIDIVMAIDVSSSMLAQDLKPDRLSALKRVAAAFVDDRTSDRIGLVVYAGESYTKTPITSDKSIIKAALREISYQGLIEDGTAIGMGLATAINRLRESEAPSKVIILLTDGVNTHGKIHPLNATEMAKEFNIRVYTIGVGTNGKAKTPVAIDPFSGKYIYDFVDVEIDEKTLKTIALETGGKYFRATDNNKLKDVYKEINELEKAKIKTIEYDIDLPEKANIFIVLGLIFLLLEFFISKYFLPSIS